MLTALPDIIQDCSHVALDSVDMHADPDTAGQAGELPGRHAQLHELQQPHLGQVALGWERREREAAATTWDSEGL